MQRTYLQFTYLTKDRVYKESSKYSKTTQFFLDGPKTSLTKICKWQTSPGKDGQYQKPAEKCKIKVQSDSTTHLPEQLILNRLTIPSAKEDVRQLTFASIAGGSVKWYDHFGNLLGSFL